MTILFSWLNSNILNEFKTCLDDPKPIDKYIESNPDVKCSEQEFDCYEAACQFEQVFLFYRSKPPCDNKLEAWLPSNVKLLCLKTDGMTDRTKYYNEVLDKISSNTDNYKISHKTLSVSPKNLPEIDGRDIKNYEMLKTFRLNKLKKTPNIFAPEILGFSTQLVEARQRAQIAQASNENVLIMGEHGTGRTSFAQAIISGRKEVNEPTVVDFQMLQYKPGLDWFGAQGILKRANKGTLLLKNIDYSSLEDQYQLLEIIKNTENGVYKFQASDKSKEKSRFNIIATTSRNLLEMSRKDKFIPELYYNLAIIFLELPSLRERISDIPQLAKYFLHKKNKKEKTIKPGSISKYLQKKTEKALQKHPWPGNIPELKMVIRQAFVFSEDSAIAPKDLPISSPELHNLEDYELKPFFKGFDLKKETEKFQKHYINAALKQANKNKTQAAILLNLKNYQTLDSRMIAIGMKQRKKEASQESDTPQKKSSKTSRDQKADSSR